MNRRQRTGLIGLQLALQAEVIRRRSELASFERALDATERRLEQNPRACDISPIAGRREYAAHCEGALYSRFCADCGASVVRCEAHGGARGCTQDMNIHSTKEHGA
jgi:hypothetical protein